MPGSVASVFSEAEDFAAALRQEGWTRLLVTGRGPFRARLTQIALHSLRLSAGDELLARIAFIAVPAGTVLVCFALPGASAPLWGGTEISRREIITVGPGERLHARTAGRSRWVAIRLPERVLREYGGVLTGASFAVPRGIAGWRPPAAARRELDNLHRAALRAAETRPEGLADSQAAYGLEQQMIQALIECLTTTPAEEESAVARRRRNVLVRLEERLEQGSTRPLAAICAEAGVSQNLLRECCKLYLGMSPIEYRLRHAIQQIHWRLRSTNPQTSTVSAIAKQYGYNGSGRFARIYTTLYGELPSATLRSSHGIASLSLGRRRMKLP